MIDGRWIDIQNYINNTQNRLVNQVAFEPLVEAYYFSADYVVNQRIKLSGIVKDVTHLCERFVPLQNDISGMTEMFNASPLTHSTPLGRGFNFQ